MRRYVFRSESLFFVGLLFFVACTFAVDHNQGKFICTQASDCPLPLNCISGRCVPDYCGEDKNCPPDYKCESGACRSKTSEGTPEDGGVLPEPVSCQTHNDCTQDQTCRPAENITARVCVTRCDVVAQKGCPANQFCVLWEGRGYCSRGLETKANVGLLCKTDIDCEIHLYCRVVKGFSPISRCTSACDIRQKGADCPKKGQGCLPLRTVDNPIGYCEPIETIVDENGICGGDLTCDVTKGLSCKYDEPKKLSYCKKP